MSKDYFLAQEVDFLIEPKSSVFVISPSPEALVKHLTDKLNCLVESEKYFQTQDTNLESLNLSTAASPADYLIIETPVFSDKPAQELKSLKKHFVKGLILKVNNVTHAIKLNDLTQEKGVLPIFELNNQLPQSFYTRDSLLKLLEKSGYTVESIIKNKTPLNPDSFTIDYDSTPTGFTDFLDSKEAGDTYEYIFKLNKIEAGVITEIFEPKNPLSELNLRLKNQEAEIEKLLTEVKSKDESLSWYRQTLREQLTSHYSHKQVYEDLCDLNAKADSMSLELNALRAENARLRCSSVETLPRLISYPIKLLMSLWSSGPLAPLSFRKTRALNNRTASLKENYPAVELITLIYNSESFLERYFEALTKIKYPADKLTIHLLDNASPDKSLDLINELTAKSDLKFKIILHRSQTNLGFSGGNNLVLKKLQKNSSSPYYFLLNHDTEVEPECIKKLVSFIRKDSQIGMVEAKQSPKEHPKFYDKYSLETSWCSGGCVLISAEALKKVGLFDERFFLYVEDVDLSWRMWLEGYRCKLNPDALCTHYTESLNENKDFSIQQYFSVRNTFYMRYKYGTRSEIKEFNKIFKQALSAQASELEKNNLLKAKQDAKRNMSSFIVDRWKLSAKQRPHWIQFDGFNFGKMRKFEDTEDGRRVIFDDVA